ncbi:MAG TPA: arsenite methyltransferase [Anaerolineales bacterium]|nr:arsenite methyltransferase [Anaerolineales bacterium]
MMTAKITPDEILTAVQAHYAVRAVQGDSCCGDDCGCGPEAAFYSDSEMLALPEDVAAFSLGCGNAVGGASLQPGETVLDLGSGGGLECFIAAREVGETGRVIGIDMTPEMLVRARAAADRMGLANVEFREGYIEALPVDSQTVDVIISNCVINLSPDKNAVLAEMHRVLKPGGRLAISDVVAGREVPGEAREDMRLWSSCASGALPIDDWERGLLALGFENIHITARAEDDTWSAAVPEAELFSALITAIKSE